MKKITNIFLILLAFHISFNLVSCTNSPAEELDTESIQSIPEELKTPLTLEIRTTDDEGNPILNNGKITLSNPWSTLKYKKNGSAFHKVSAGKNKSAVIEVAPGDIITFFADGSENDIENAIFFKISCNVNCYVYGNLMSLLNSENYPSAKEITKRGAFSGLFSSNENINIQQDKKFYLPATKLSERCYESMFARCSKLENVPALPATKLESQCYLNMFCNCSNLSEPPALPADILAESCYAFMFYGCTNLTNPPELPASKLAESCYSWMFYHCSKLNTPPSLPATNLAYNCYFRMFDGCSFEKAPELPAMTLEKDCYSGMFYNCTKLKEAPVLAAQTLAAYCYCSMFYGCNKLNSITCLATDISAQGCFNDWLLNTEHGILYISPAAADLDWHEALPQQGWSIEFVQQN